MSPIIPADAVLQFREKHDTSELADHLATEDYLVTKVVKDMGQLIGLKADSIYAGWNAETSQTELLDAYRELASTTSQLLDFYSVVTISDEAVYSVSHRLADQVDPFVSLHARVDHLYRSYKQEEANNIMTDAEKLWAALEYRCEQITGLRFAEVLHEG